MIVPSLTNESWLLGRGTALLVWSSDRCRCPKPCFLAASLQGRSTVLGSSDGDLSKISKTSYMSLTFLLFVLLRHLIPVDKVRATPIWTFSADETTCEEDLLVVKEGLGCFCCGDASLDREIAASSLADLLLAFLSSGSSVEDSCSAGRSLKFEPCNFHLSTSSAGPKHRPI